MNVAWESEPEDILYKLGQDEPHKSDYKLVQPENVDMFALVFRQLDLHHCQPEIAHHIHDLGVGLLFMFVFFNVTLP